jgi:hypothetical protein
MLEQFLLYTPDKAFFRADLDPKIQITRALAREFADVFVPLETFRGRVRRNRTDLLGCRRRSSDSRRREADCEVLPGSHKTDYIGAAISMTIYEAISELTSYGIKNDLIEPMDEVYIINSLLPLFKLDSFEKPEVTGTHSLDEILGFLCDFAAEKGIIPDYGVVSRDLFDTAVMGVLSPAHECRGAVLQPACKQSAERDRVFLKLGKEVNYSRATRIAKTKNG